MVIILGTKSFSDLSFLFEIASKRYIVSFTIIYLSLRDLNLILA